MDKISAIPAILSLLLSPQLDGVQITATWSYQETNISGFLLFQDKNNDERFSNSEIIADIQRPLARQWKGVIALRKGRNAFAIRAYRNNLRSALSKPAYFQHD